MLWLLAGCLLVQTRWYTTQTLMDIRQAWDVGLSTNILFDFIQMKCYLMLYPLSCSEKSNLKLFVQLSKWPHFQVLILTGSTLNLLSQLFYTFLTADIYRMWWNIEGMEFWRMYAHQTYVGQSHLCSVFRGKFWLGKFLTNWLSFAKFTNIYPSNKVGWTHSKLWRHN